MTAWHGYFGIENLALSTAQRAALVTALRTLGPASDPSPACLNHWRTRLDGDAMIFEAAFNEAALTVDAWKNQLGIIFSVDAATIDHDLNAGANTIVVFSQGGTDYLRVALFGGIGATWAESGDACRAYLAVHAAEWENNLS